MRREISSGKKSLGFTLVELMIAVAVMAILTAIAYPMYQEQVQKSRRNAVKGSMLQLSQFLERNYTETMRYNTDADGNTISSIGDVYNLSVSSNTSFLDDWDKVNQHYTVSITTTISGYTISAVPKGGQLDDMCENLTITSTGSKTTSSNYTCW
ncbi:MAG: prepilin-type N-terminal cleavage/methylation domain-containing protein [Gammaproteobacteria bacterium]|nr:prepilin-type N-terminal cleavage/methylation domain-containing protein [Gammaproteobacteria bacterium]MCP5417861.1 prepilin-type N-terminal cleavage/methylation domain-containing protein [Chromatiaceae bacterium]